MGARNNDRIDTVQAEKVVIVAGPSFGSAMKFMLFGAVLGATAALLWSSTRASAETDATVATASSEKAEARAAQLLNRLTSLAKRIRSLAVRVRSTAQQAGEVIIPAVSEAIHEARSASKETEEEIKSDITRADGSGHGAL